MKKNVFFFLLLLNSVCCFAQSKISPANEINFPDTSLHSFRYISKEDAELILEQSSYLKDSIWKIEGGIWKFKCTYLTSKKDTSTKQAGRLFFGFENYKQLAEAKRFFELMKNENEKSNTIINSEKIADDSFLSKDALNNPFLIIRKNNKVFKLKVYQISSATSLSQLFSLAHKLVAEQ